MSLSRKNPVSAGNLMARGSNGVLCTMITLGLVAMLCAEVAAEPRKVTSNSQVLLDATLFDIDTGEDVQLLGLIHVQTKVNPSESTLAVHANIREAAFLAFAENDQAPSNSLLERLELLKEQVRELKSQIVALQQQIFDLMNELQTVLETDTEPLIPGLQIDTERAHELQRRIQQASAALKRLQGELSELLNEMRDLLDEIQELQESDEEPADLINVYTATGVFSAGPSICDHLACERIIDLDLIRADGGALPFQVRLNLQFTQRGALLFGEAALEDGAPDGDDDDDDDDDDT
jgi:prefoldin subunit 5